MDRNKTQLLDRIAKEEQETKYNAQAGCVQTSWIDTTLRMRLERELKQLDSNIIEIKNRQKEIKHILSVLDKHKDVELLMQLMRHL